ncbi:MAG: hypothetical protein IT347_00060 [Candidatus Eisenbacteria bacterium]|nr:hypothetical protein [Candidatus Eisenbacteria bacterium]
MRGERVRRRAFAALALAAAAPLAGLLGSCAPPVRPVPAVDDMAARYDESRVRREQALQALTADLLVRVDGRATGRLPGLPATLALAAPDRARLRVGALFGTAVDVCAQGDSVIAWLPSERTALALAGARESLGIAPPVGLLARSFGATWNPPREAWREASPESAGLRLKWREGSDSLELLIDRDSRPARVRLAGESGSVSVRYSGWERVAGTEWPGQLEIGDGTGWARVRLGVDAVHVAERADDGWFALRIPDGARRLDWDGLRDWLERRKGAR